MMNIDRKGSRQRWVLCNCGGRNAVSTSLIATHRRFQLTRTQMNNRNIHFDELPQLLLDYDNPSTINYLYFENEKATNIVKLHELVSQYSRRLKEHPNDITVLSFRISVLREFECYYRYKTKERTN
jgi:hypothetical protein